MIIWVYLMFEESPVYPKESSRIKLVKKKKKGNVN